MNRKSSLLDRFKFELGNQIISVISGAILLVFLARYLDSESYGLFFLSISIFTFIKLLSKLGIAKSAARYIAEYKEKNPSQTRNIISFSFRLNIIIIIIVCSALFFTNEYIAALLQEPDISSLLKFGTLFIGFGTLMLFSRFILQGFEDIQASGLVNIIDRVSRLAFVVLFVILGYGAIGALAGYILGAGMAALIGLIYIYWNYYRFSEQSPMEEGLKRRIGEYAVPLTLTNSANVIDKHVDTILVGFFIGPIAVAYYTVAKQVITFIVAPMKALGFTLAPTYESETARGNSEKAAELYENTLFHALLLYLPAAAGLILLADPFVEVIFGNEYSGAISVLQVLSIYAIMLSITDVTSDALDFLGRARERAIVKGATSLLNVVFNIILIPFLGVIGAAVATIITFTTYTMANLYIINMEFDLRVKWLVHRLVYVFAITLGMSSWVYVSSQYTENIIILILIIISAIVIWAIGTLLTGIVDIKELSEKY